MGLSCGKNKPSEGEARRAGQQEQDENLSKRSGHRAVLDKITFDIYKGEMPRIVGLTDDGKTTSSTACRVSFR